MSYLHSKVTKVLCSIVLVPAIALAIVGPSSAETAYADTHAIVVQPVAFTETSDMNFGTVVQNEEGGGQVALKPDGVLVVQGVLVADMHQVATASFKLLGSDNQAYTISLPEAVTFIKGSDSIRLNTFTHNAGETPVMGLHGNDNFNIGATLLLNKRQSVGLYTGTVKVTISNN